MSPDSWGLLSADGEAVTPRMKPQPCPLASFPCSQPAASTGAKGLLATEAFKTALWKPSGIRRRAPGAHCCWRRPGLASSSPPSLEARKAPPLPETETAGQTANIWPLGSVECEEPGFFLPKWKKRSAPQSWAMAPSRESFPEGRLAPQAAPELPPICQLHLLAKGHGPLLKTNMVMWCFMGKGAWQGLT